MKIFTYEEFITESLPRESSVKQLQKLRKMTKGTDIGDRISDMNKQGANIHYIHNPVDTGIESYEDYEKGSNKLLFHSDFDSKNPLNNQKKTPREYIGVKPKNGYGHEMKHLHHKNKKKKADN
jgi:hypothetical protein